MDPLTPSASAAAARRNERAPSAWAGTFRRHSTVLNPKDWHASPGEGKARKGLSTWFLNKGAADHLISVDNWRYPS